MLDNDNDGGTGDDGDDDDNDGDDDVDYQNVVCATMDVVETNICVEQC